MSMLDDSKNPLNTEQTRAIANRLLEALSLEYKRLVPKDDFVTTKPNEVVATCNALT